jgi:glycosyltransferase involved in cell wall biosynthesis
MYAGSHGIINALEHVVEAARRLEGDPDTQHVRFRLIGEGTEKQALMRRSEGLRNVAFEPAVDGRRIPFVLAEADAFVISARDAPLYRYGIAMNKFADYMAIARPIVIGVGRGVDTPMAAAGSAITVAPENPVEMAAAIKRLAMMSREERWQMGLRGRIYVEKRLTVERLVDGLESLIQPRTGASPFVSVFPVSATSEPSRGRHVTSS